MTLLFSLCSLVGLFVSLCGPSHPTFESTGQFLPNSTHLVLHPGDCLPLTWTPSPSGRSTAPSPDQIRIAAGLIGPYPTTTAAMDAKRTINPPSLHTVARSVAATTPVQTDSWHATPHQAPLCFPATLHPGSSLLVQVVEKNGITWGSIMEPLVVCAVPPTPAVSGERTIR